MLRETKINVQLKLQSHWAVITGREVGTHYWAFCWYVVSVTKMPLHKRYPPFKALLCFSLPMSIDFFFKKNTTKQQHYCSHNCFMMLFRLIAVPPSKGHFLGINDWLGANDLLMHLRPFNPQRKGPAAPSWLLINKSVLTADLLDLHCPELS